MKKILATVCIVVLIFSLCFIKAEAIATRLHNPEKNTKEILYQDIFVTLLMPQINKAIDDFYGKYLTELPGEDPWAVKVLDIQRPNGDRTSYFIIKFEVMPYLGPHNSVGVDNITIAVKYGEEPEVTKFEHIKSYPIPQNYHDMIKAKWPPE